MFRFNRNAIEQMLVELKVPEATTAYWRYGRAVEVENGEEKDVQRDSGVYLTFPNGVSLSINWRFEGETVRNCHGTLGDRHENASVEVAAFYQKEYIYIPGFIDPGYGDTIRGYVEKEELEQIIKMLVAMENPVKIYSFFEN